MTETKAGLNYAWYVVALLTLANISSFLDRQILALLVGFIKRDMHLSDTKVSLLMGLSFAMFYTIFGIIIGRLADTNQPQKYYYDGRGCMEHYDSAVCRCKELYPVFFS